LTLLQTQAATAKSHAMTATNTLFIIAFVAVVLLSVFFGGGAMTGDTIKGGTGEAGWMIERSWMWTPALISLVLGLLLGGVINKKGLLQTQWDNVDIRSFGQTTPDPLHSRLDIDRIAPATLETITPTVLGIAAPAPN